MIILIGLPKSGTTSFHKLFLKLGYNSYHWKKNKRYIGILIKRNKNNNKPLLNDFKNTDVITQMDICISYNKAYWPQITDFEQLYYENPEAIFILNKRKPENLLLSFKKWNNLHKRLYTYNPEIISDKTDEAFINFVNNYYNNIEFFFSKQLSAKFISFNIETDNIIKLKKYIDIKDISKFPKENVNKKNHNFRN
jgi:hypothetical protein